MPAKIAMKRQPSCRMGTKKFASIGSVDLGQAEGLSRIDQIGIADLILVGLEDGGEAPTFAVMRAGDVPEIVAGHGLLAFELHLQPRDRLAVLRQPVDAQSMLAGVDRLAGRQPPATVG